MPIIEAHDLHIVYGQVHAVRGINLTVEAGEVVGLLGGNGAGKSSTLRAVAAVNPHTGGSLRVDGHDLSDIREADAARGVVGYCPDVGGLIRQATVREHIALTLTFRSQAHLWPQALTLLERFGLHEVLDRVTQGFSHGMSRRLSVLLATLAAQRALVLDEPFDGVDPLGVEETLAVIDDARAAGLAVLVSTHLLDLITECADRVLVMNSGTVVDENPVAAYRGADGKERYRETLRSARLRAPEVTPLAGAEASPPHHPAERS